MLWFTKQWLWARSTKIGAQWSIMLWRPDRRHLSVLSTKGFAIMICKHAQKYSTWKARSTNYILVTWLQFAPFGSFDRNMGVVGCVMIPATCAFVEFPFLWFQKGKLCSNACAPVHTWQYNASVLAWLLSVLYIIYLTVTTTWVWFVWLRCISRSYLHRFSATKAGQLLCGSGLASRFNWNFHTLATNNYFYNHLFVIVFVAFIVIYLMTLFITPGVMTQSLLRPLLFKLAVKALCWVMSQCCLFVQV